LLNKAQRAVGQSLTGGGDGRGGGGEGCGGGGIPGGWAGGGGGVGGLDGRPIGGGGKVGGQLPSWQEMCGKNGMARTGGGLSVNEKAIFV
jgi:hypothetical protein